ncbi:MAG: response regulator [Planctomycetes bacterium]|nr:response regulator [Planctomycetota bacterium]
MPEEAKAPEATADTSTAAKGAASQNAGWRHALVIEDSMPLRRMFSKILSTQKISGIEAANGKEALDLLAEHTPEKFSVIVCDLMMPVLDGPSFIAAARKVYPDSLPPIIVCSSRSDREAIQVVMKLSVSGYILKPFKTETVISKLRELFPDLVENNSK